MTNEPVSTKAKPQVDNAAWKEIVLKYQQASTWRASWQIINTVVPYALCWYLMYLCLPVSWWLVCAAGGAGRRAAGARVHHFSRLRPRLVFQIARRQRRGGISHGHSDVHAVLSLALGTCHPPQQLRRSRQARHRRRLDHDGAGISGSRRAGKNSPTGCRAIHSCCSSSRRCFCSWSGSGFPRPRPASGNAIPSMR